MDKSIHIVVELVSKDGKFDEMKEIFNDLALATRKEEGVISYTFMEDQNKPNTLLSIEKWTDEESEKKHWNMPHLKTALQKAGSVLATEPIVHKGVQVI